MTASLSDRALLEGMADAYRAGVEDAYRTLVNAFLDVPESISAREMGRRLKRYEGDLAGGLVAGMDQWLAEHLGEKE